MDGAGKGESEYVTHMNEYTRNVEHCEMFFIAIC